MFGDDLDDDRVVAEAIVGLARKPDSWLGMAYRLKRQADDVIERWNAALTAAFDAQRTHYERFPLDYWTAPGRAVGERVPVRPGERESELAVSKLQRSAVPGSPDVYMMLVGLAVENLTKGLLVAEEHIAVRGVDHFLDDGKLLPGLPAGGHGLFGMLRILEVELSNDERSVLRRLELAVAWRGRYPVPISQKQVQVEPFGSDENSASPGYFSMEFVPRLDALYERLFAKLHAHAPGWIPWWEPRSIWEGE